MSRCSEQLTDCEHTENADNTVTAQPGLKQWHKHHAKRLEYLRRAWLGGIHIPSKFIGGENDCTGSSVIANVYTITKRYLEKGLPLENMWAAEQPGSRLDTGLMPRHLRLAKKSRITNGVVQAARREVQQEDWPATGLASPDLSTVIEESSVLPGDDDVEGSTTEAPCRMELGLSRLSDDDDCLLQDSDDGDESVVDTGRCLRDSVHEPSSPVLSTICAGE